MRNRIAIVMGLFAALMLAQLVPAQEAEPTERRPDLIERLNFEGGNVVEYVALIRRLVPEANIVLMPGAEQFQMPAMELRNVTVGQAAHLIQTTASVPPNARLSIGRDGNVIAVHIQFGLQPAPQPRLYPTVLSLADIISEDLRAEDVLTSIEIALQLFGEDYPKANVRYHDATRLLIARGHPEQVSYIGDVVEQLRAGRPRRDPRQVIGDPVHTAAQVQLQERRIKELQQRIAELEAALARAREND
jgi:hypothetical protein